jgi:hypothetical protein
MITCLSLGVHSDIGAEIRQGRDEIFMHKTTGNEQ